MGLFVIVLYFVMVLSAVGGVCLLNEDKDPGAAWNCFCVTAVAFGLWLGVMF